MNAVGDLRGIVGDFYALGMARVTSFDLFVVSGVRFAPRVTGDYRDDATSMLEDSLNAPETTARKHGLFVAVGRGDVGIDGRLRERRIRVRSGA